MGHEPSEHRVEELRRIWLDWLRTNVPSLEVVGVDLDALCLITYQMLLPKPEIEEINDGVRYMLGQFVARHAEGLAYHPLAARLHAWRAGIPDLR